MRLVKSGHVVDDRYVRVLDDAPIPDDVPVIVPAARFLADAADIALTIHPHPTLSEAVMEAAGVADGRSIHL